MKKESEPPCVECLKYAICLSKMRINCIDLVNWLNQGDSKEHRGDRIARFEKDYWNKDIGVYSIKQPDIAFRFKRSNHQCLILK
jgi:hypothetical protein